MTTKWHMKPMKRLVLPCGVSSRVLPPSGESISFRFQSDEFSSWSVSGIFPGLWLFLFEPLSAHRLPARRSRKPDSTASIFLLVSARPRIRCLSANCNIAVMCGLPAALSPFKYEFRQGLVQAKFRPQATDASHRSESLTARRCSSSAHAGSEERGSWAWPFPARPRSEPLCGVYQKESHRMRPSLRSCRGALFQPLKPPSQVAGESGPRLMGNLSMNRFSSSSVNGLFQLFSLTSCISRSLVG